MKIKVFIILMSLLLSSSLTFAQEETKSDLHKRAEAVDANRNIATARSLYIHAFNDYANKGQTRQAAQCGTIATSLYYKESYYKEAFELLRRIDQVILADKQSSESTKASIFYLVTKERLQMYMKLKKVESAKDQLNMMETLANRSGDDNLKNDVLYNKAIYYYTFGYNEKGNAVFKEMAKKLTAEKEYDKVEEVYKTLIANGRRSNSANLVAQSYSGYMAWKDSVSALKTADQIDSLKQRITTCETEIAEKDSSLTTRQVIIVGLSILAAALAAALIIGAIILMRFILLTRKQEKTIRLANESNALKSKFISNISAQLEPTLQKLDNRIPEVKALLSFSNHVQTLSELENTPNDAVQKEDTQIPPFCEKLMDEIRDKVKTGVILKVQAQNMRADINREYVSHILSHLLHNAADYTPEGGTVTLEFKKRGPHAYQFLVTNSGQPIPEEKHEDIFKPFLEVRDLTTGDGLGLPICKQMALKMNGDLDLDTTFTKGTRFVLDLHA